MARLMEARPDLAVRNDSPQLTDDDRLATMKAGFWRPVDETISDPAVDAPALGLKSRDDLQLGAADEIDEVSRWVVARPQYQTVICRIKANQKAAQGDRGEDFRGDAEFGEFVAEDFAGVDGGASPPMTLSNMRANGVHAVTATCEACGHKADVNVDALPESVTVPGAGNRLRCSQCGGKTISTRPAWHTARRAGVPDFRPSERPPMS